MNQNNQQNQKNQGNDTAFGLGVLALVGCAVYTQKEAQIHLWLYQNLMSVVAYVILGFALLVTYRIYQMKKKHEQEFARARALQSVKPERNPRNYYERKW